MDQHDSQQAQPLRELLRYLDEQSDDDMILMDSPYGAHTLFVADLRNIATAARLAFDSSEPRFVDPLTYYRPAKRTSLVTMLDRAGNTWKSVKPEPPKWVMILRSLIDEQATCDDIELETGLKHLSSRISNLKSRGWVQETGKEAITATGRQARVIRITKSGQAELKKWSKKND